MIFLFVVLFLLSSQLIRSVAIDQQQGINPYPFGTWVFTVALHILLLASSIFYLGWVWGIILFLTHLLGVLDLTVMWILNIPLLFIKDPRHFLTLATVKRNSLFPFLIVDLIFTIASFIVSDYKALFHFLRDIPYSLIVILAVAFSFSIPRFIIMKLTSKPNEHPPAAPRHNSTIPHSRQNRFDSIFNSHLLKCGEVLSTSGFDYTASNMFDIYAIVYVISDFAVFNAGKNRDAATARMLPHIFRELSYLSSTDPKPQFRERIGFYSEVISGIPLHAHCLPGVDISDANPVLGCAIAFCDCFLHPAYISNYNAAAPQLSALDVFEVTTDLLEPLNEALTALYNDIYDYAE